MLNVLKKLLLVLSFVVSFGLSSQNSITLNSYQYNQWKQIGTTCYGCSSFFIMVVNQVEPSSDGYYYYTVYLWSNSTYANGYVASTYVKNINIYSKDISGAEAFLLKTDYALIPPKSVYFNGAYQLAYVYSGSARQIIKITWDDIAIW